MLDAIFGIGAFLIKAAVVAVKKAVNYVVDLIVDDVSTKINTSIRKSSITQLSVVKGVDAEIVDLERKQARDGRLSTRDVDRLLELKAEREAEHQKYRKAKEHELLAGVRQQPNDYTQSPIQNGRLNLLQYHMGQIVLEKHCPSCGAPMLLQHRNIPYELSQGDFFWQCSRYYWNDGKEKCKGQPFNTSDVHLLHKKDVPELQVASKDLDIIGLQPIVQEGIQKRVREHLGCDDDEILCPVHYVPLVLRQKREHNGSVLDMYHLRCPHLSQDREHCCGHLVKLKSIPQLASYLRRAEGRGILD